MPGYSAFCLAFVGRVGKQAGECHFRIENLFPDESFSLVSSVSHFFDLDHHRNKILQDYSECASRRDNRVCVDAWLHSCRSLPSVSNFRHTLRFELDRMAV